MMRKGRAGRPALMVGAAAAGVISGAAALAIPRPSRENASASPGGREGRPGMGIAATQVSFAAPAPDLAAVAARASELCGLAVEARESSAEVKGGLFAHHGALAFACAPVEAVEAYAYRPG